MIGVRLNEDDRKQKMVKINHKEMKDLVQEIIKKINKKIEINKKEKKEEDHNLDLHPDQAKIIIIS